METKSIMDHSKQNVTNCVCNFQCQCNVQSQQHSLTHTLQKIKSKWQLNNTQFYACTLYNWSYQICGIIIRDFFLFFKKKYTSKVHLMYICMCTGYVWNKYIICIIKSTYKTLTTTNHHVKMKSVQFNNI